ncbi:MAG: ferritin-like domain-containing protein [Cellvibrionaceae bacterium]
MEKSETIGSNRTGIDASPIHSKKMQSGVQDYAPSSGDGNQIEAIRREQLERAERLGSVPLPGTAKGMLKTMLKKFTGHQPATFVNKLGERLAYERTGVRIYEALILKCQVANSQGETRFDLPLDQLVTFCAEEGKHFRLLIDCMEQLGVDPTAQTPDADVSGVASSGMLKVITDPRTTISQCLETMLAVELTDNAAWELLIQLAQDLGQGEMASKFEEALAEEQIHLDEIRAWYEQSVRAQAGTTH